MGASPLPSRGPKSGRRCYITPAFSGVPNKGDKIRIGCLTPAFLEARKRVEMPHNPLILGGPQQRAQNQNGLPHPYLLGGPKSGRKCYITRAFSGVPNKGHKFRMGCLTRAFWGAQKWAEMLHNPCILRGPQQR